MNAKAKRPARQKQVIKSSDFTYPKFVDLVGERIKSTGYNDEGYRCVIRASTGTDSVEICGDAYQALLTHGPIRIYHQYISNVRGAVWYPLAILSLMFRRHGAYLNPDQLIQNTDFAARRYVRLSKKLSECKTCRGLLKNL